MHIRIVSPAGQIKAALIDRGAQTLREWGHQVTIGQHAKDTYGRFAGLPQDRAQDIIDALNDPQVDVLWCSRGGYGVMQMIDQIPTDLIRQARKPIVGFSDITALHALWQKAGVGSLHAPMMKHLADEPTHRTSKTLRELLSYYEEHRTFPPRHNALFFNKAKLVLAPGQGWSDQAPDSEAAEALFDRLKQNPPAFVGGNLSVLNGLHGTPFDFDYAGKILVIEDIAESPYKVDRMLQTLRLMGVFGVISGLVVGHFTQCDDDPTMPIRLWDSIRMYTAPYDIPVWLGVPLGHETENFPAVMGEN